MDINNQKEFLLDLLCSDNVGDVLREHADEIGVILPEVKELYGFPQVSKYHDKDIWEHTIAAIEAVPADPVLRMTMLLHDVGKPDCCKRDKQGGLHFRGHARRGAVMAAEILQRLGYSPEEIKLICFLIYTHDDEIEPEEENVKKWLERTGGRRVMEMVLQVMIADAKGKTKAAEEEWVDILTRTGQCMEKVLKDDESLRSE